MKTEDLKHKTFKYRIHVIITSKKIVYKTD